MFKVKIINIIIGTLCLFFTTEVLAIGNGFYLGLMAGPAKNNADIIFAQAVWPPGTNFNIVQPPILTLVEPKTQQFGVRIFGGNQFSQYAAIELGLTLYGQITYTTIDDDIETISGTNKRIRTIDLVGKGMLPLGCFNIFVKLGGAGTYITTSGGLNPTGIRPADSVRGLKLIDRGRSRQEFKFAPTFSIGASYDINQKWQADISANYLLVGGHVNRVTFYAIGIAYHFADVYCGQFLCDE